MLSSACSFFEQNIVSKKDLLLLGLGYVVFGHFLLFLVPVELSTACRLSIPVRMSGEATVTNFLINYLFGSTLHRELSVESS